MIPLLLGISFLCAIVFAAVLVWLLIQLVKRQPISAGPLVTVLLACIIIGAGTGLFGMYQTAKKLKNEIVEADPVGKAGAVVGRTVVEGGSGLAEGFDKALQEKGDELARQLVFTIESQPSDKELVVLVQNRTDRSIYLPTLLSEGQIMGVDESGVDLFGEHSGKPEGATGHTLPPGSKTRHHLRFEGSAVGIRVGTAVVKMEE